MTKGAVMIFGSSRAICLLLVLVFSMPVLNATASAALAQTKDSKAVGEKKTTPRKEELTPAPTKVEVQPLARDEEIRKRLLGVLEATEWFTNPKVRVDKGVVFLSGTAPTEELKTWASNLARNTQDVVAVANKMEVAQPSALDFAPAWDGLIGLWRDIIRILPWIIFGLIVLLLSGLIGWLTSRGLHIFLRHRVRARVLRGVLAASAGIFMFLTGTYIVLRVAGLTQLALTVVGGTGLVGLAVGIAFRNITENFLASIFLSMQRPFETGDLIEVSGVTGYVQQLNVRSTVLMALEGNLLQLPNSLIYSSVIRNFSSNPNRRESILVGIGYADRIDAAQEIIRQVLDEHPGVLKDPAPWVLVDELGKSSVRLRVYFWLNGEENSWLKVRSSVMRLIKRALQQHGISLPHEIYQVDTPVNGVDQAPDRSALPSAPNGASLPGRAGGPKGKAFTKAEAGLSSEAGELEDQARQAKPLAAGEDLLRSQSDK
jgi:small-conductance mechanosensitive channel